MDQHQCSNCETFNSPNARYCHRCGYELPKKITEILPESSLEEKSHRKNLSVKSLLGVVLGIAIMVSLEQYFFKTPTIDETMMELASEMNKSCPVMIDGETRLDNTIALPDKVFQYNYTLVNMVKSTTDTLALKNKLAPTIANFVRTNPQMKFQRDNKATLNYLYKDQTGQYLFLISITPDQYEL